jgi:transposase, IS30 family
MSASHLSYTEHYQIQCGQAQGLSPVQIAHRLGRHVDTIRRALKRFAHGYQAELAYQGALARRAVSAANHPTKPDRLWQSVERRLRRHDSPEQIVLARAYRGAAPVSIQAIYDYIERDRQASGTLYQGRRRPPGRRCRQDGKRKSWAHLAKPLRTRPAAASRRKRAGHLEIDTMVGKKRDRYRLLVAVDRHSGWLMLARVKSGEAVPTARALKRLLANHAYMPVVTLTSDRGMEFADLPRYFYDCHYVCEPYRPGQRGLCENTIGLIRQYLPKYESLDGVSQARLNKIAELINTRPRKRLGGRTPKQVISRRIRAAATRG